MINSRISGLSRMLVVLITIAGTGASWDDDKGDRRTVAGRPAGRHDHRSASEERPDQGILPDNVGLSGRIGENINGKWWGSYYGWRWPHGLFNQLESALKG